MNSVLSIVFPPAPEREADQQDWQAESAQRLPVAAPATEADDTDNHAAAVEGADQFTRRQLTGLVQRVFFPGWPRPSRQVVISPVDDTTPTAAVCARIAQSMAEDLPGTVCAVEAATTSPGLQDYLAAAQPSASQNRAPLGLPHPNCIRVSGNLWLLTMDAFLRDGYDQPKVTWLRSRLSQLRREFEYTIIHAPAATACSDVALLGQLADGVILVVQAHSTRRATALSARDALCTANIRLLGLVLNDRTFPVPEAIYSKL